MSIITGVYRGHRGVVRVIVIWWVAIFFISLRVFHFNLRTKKSAVQSEAFREQELEDEIWRQLELFEYLIGHDSACASCLGPEIAAPTMRRSMWRLERPGASGGKVPHIFGLCPINQNS